MNVTNQQLATILADIDSTRIFTAIFIKRSTGEVRHMNCMKGVTKHLVGGTLGYDPAAHNLVNVYDVQKKAYRNINLDSLIGARIDGTDYVVA